MCRVGNETYKFVKPYYLQNVNDFRLIKAVVVGTSLRWNINGNYITYNQLKNNK